MYSFILIPLIFSLNISVIQASCNKTLRLGETNETILVPSVTYKYESRINQRQHKPHQSSRSEDREREFVDQSNELDNLRLEYNKYKILSYLGITTDPDSIMPSLNRDSRLELISSSEFANSAKEVNGASRHKRSLACDQVKSNKDACCLETFYVNFTDIGWDKWILYPAGYNANYCRGQCDLSHARYYHSTLLSKFSSVIGLCCSPRQMAPLRLLYIDEENKVHQKSMPDMIVEACDCA